MKIKLASGKKNQRRTEKSLVRASAGEYLIFVAAGGKGGVEVVYADENVWLTPTGDYSRGIVT